MGKIYINKNINLKVKGVNALTYRSYPINGQDIREEIEISRLELYSLIENNNDFANQEVISQSQKLDRLLNVYEAIKLNKVFNEI